MSRSFRVFRNLNKKVSSAAMSLLLVTMQVAAVVSPFIINTQTARALDTGFSTPTATHTPNDWDTNTVSNVQTSDDLYIDENDGGEQGYANFNIPAITAGSTINGIEVKAEAKSNDNGADCRLRASLSWNNGSSYSSTLDKGLGETDSTVTFGNGATETWGRTWSSTEFTNANFVVKLQDNDPGSDCTNDAKTSVDLLQVKVYYTEPVPKPELTAIKTNNVNGQATYGQSFTWNIRVQNSGPGIANFVNGNEILRDERSSSGVSSYGLASAVAGNGATGTVSCAVSGGGVNANLTCSASGAVMIPVNGYFDISYTATPNSNGTLSNPTSGGICRVDRNNVIDEVDNSNASNNCSNSVTVNNTAAAVNPSLPMSCGLDIALVLDNSTSISSGEMTSMKNAMTAFTSAFAGTPTEFSVTRFATTASVEQPFTNNITDVNDAIDDIPVGGGFTNWEDGFIKAASTLPNRSNPNLVIFASDGNPNTIGNGPGDNASPDGSPAAMNPAILQANALKNAGTRILAIGIGSDLSVANMQAISGSNVDTGNVLTSDVITSDFNTLAADLAEFAEQTCGGTITAKKLIDADGNLQTTNDQTPAQNWMFDVNGSPSNPAPGATDAQGFTQAFDVDPGTYSVNETVKDGYKLLGASCSGASNNGSKNGNAVTGVVVSNSNIVTCTFINTPTKARLTVTKNVINNNGGTKTAAQFPLFVNGNSVTSGIQQDYAPGTYTITETQQAGYVQTIVSGDCTKNQQGVISVTLADNQTATCTITNDDQPGTLIVNKIVTNNNGGTKTASDFGFKVNGGSTVPFEADGSNSVTVNAGTYTVSEPTVSGYTASYNNCASLQIPVGGTATCMITNDDQAPALTLVKNVINNNGGNAFANAWTLTAVGTAGSPTNLSGTTGISSSANFKADTYTLNEANGPSGYSASDWSCTNGVMVTQSKITLANGVSTTCTITNDDIAPLLTIIKYVHNHNGGTLTVPNFPLFVDGSQVTSGQQKSYNAGSHTVSETQQSGYELYDLDGDCYFDEGVIKVNLSIGGVYTCKLKNEDTPGSITLIKKVTNDNGGTLGVNDFGLSIGGTAVESGEKVVVNANKATVVDEAGAAGYAFVSITGEGCPEVLGGTVTVEPGEDIVCTITNDDQAPKVIVKKKASPSNTETSFGFTLTSNGEQYANFSIPSGGKYDTGQGLKPGDVVITEHETEGWSLKEVECYEVVGKYQWVSIGDPEFTAELGKTYICIFENEQSSTVIVTKFHDINENGWWDDGEPALPDWDMTITPFGEVICEQNNERIVALEVDDSCDDASGARTETTDEEGNAMFQNVDPGYYDLSETLKDEWEQSALYCDSDQQQPSLDIAAINKANFWVGAGQTVHCYVGNHVSPNYTITKTNNTIAPVFRGNIVKYTITVTVPGSSNSGIVHSNCNEEEDGCDASDAVTVTDLPPKGVQYIPGTWTADMTNEDGSFDLKDMGITSEPTYGSPGTWLLTNSAHPTLVPGSVITLTYLAKVLDNAALGSHLDAAFSKGFDNGGNIVFALGSNNTPFVSTKVLVATTDPTPETYVLTLTDTGDMTKLGSFIGIVMVVGALAVTMKKGKRNMTKILGGLLLLPAAIVIFGAHAHAAAPVIVQLNQPQSPTKVGNFNLDYTVLTTDGGETFDVTLYRNGVPVGTQSVSHANGNSGSFPTNLVADGTYVFKAKAVVTSGPDSGAEYETANVVVSYDGTAPAPIAYGGKTVSGNTYTFKFTAPVGSDAVKALVFASPNTNFPLNASTQVGAITITPGVQQSFSYTAPTSQPYYFAALLIDSAGNVSIANGDKEASAVAQAGAVRTASTSSASDGGSDDGSTNVLSAEDAAKLATLLANNDKDADTMADNNKDDDKSNLLIWVVAIAAAIAVATIGINWYSKRNLDK